jgi:hypothetical protein
MSTQEIILVEGRINFHEHKHGFSTNTILLDFAHCLLKCRGWFHVYSLDLV